MMGVLTCSCLVGDAYKVCLHPPAHALYHEAMRLPMCDTRCVFDSSIGSGRLRNFRTLQQRSDLILAAAWRGLGRDVDLQMGLITSLGMALSLAQPCIPEHYIYGHKLTTNRKQGWQRLAIAFGCANLPSKTRHGLRLTSGVRILVHLR